MKKGNFWSNEKSKPPQAIVIINVSDNVHDMNCRSKFGTYPSITDEVASKQMCLLLLNLVFLFHLFSTDCDVDDELAAAALY